MTETGIGIRIKCPIPEDGIDAEWVEDCLRDQFPALASISCSEIGYEWYVKIIEHMSLESPLLHYTVDIGEDGRARLVPINYGGKPAK